MNALLLAGVGIAWFVLMYKWYGRRISSKLVSPDDNTPTPAYAKRDGVDYNPANPFVLFGHHFSSIAGAGPIIGPVIGVGLFGWGPVLLWILLGTIFIGAVHDYLSLMISVRREGRSMGDVAESAISPTAKLLFSVFIWLALVLVIAVFASVTAKTLVESPRIVIPTFALVFVAMGLGVVMNRKLLPLPIATLLALIVQAGFVYLGSIFPVSLSESSAFYVWFVVLSVYAFFASVLPVGLLLCPRDYLSMYVLFLGMFLGYVGLIFAHPTLHIPSFVSFASSKGPLWPMLFVIVACGAISGFHSLVASGTTSKQLSKESQGLAIGYGGMVMEGALALLTVLVVGSALYWKTAPSVGLADFVYQSALKEGWIVAFGRAFGRIVSAVPLLTYEVGFLFGVMMLNTFVLTTLDTSSRLGRFIFTELAPKGILRNRWVATFCTLLPAFYLGISGKWSTIWPVFGAANQLVGALVLLTITSYLFLRGKPTVYTLVPTAFMLITTIGALLWQCFAPHKGFWMTSPPNVVLGIVAILLVILALFVVKEGIGVWQRKAKTP